jgi:hypothetical protein
MAAKTTPDDAPIQHLARSEASYGLSTVSDDPGIGQNRAEFDGLWMAQGRGTEFVTRWASCSTGKT